MSSSGTYAYNPEIAEFCDEAFERAGIDPKGVTAEHLFSARRSLNLMFSNWATRGVHLFAIDEQTQTLTDGTASYNAATGTLAILECVVRRSTTDTPVERISREQYHMIPDKTAEGLPSQIYFDRRTLTYKLWQVPENSTDVLRYFRLRRLQDATAASETLDVPYYWFDALAAGLAARLAAKFNFERFGKLHDLAEDAFLLAKEEDRERGDFSMVPA